MSRSTSLQNYSQLSLLLKTKPKNGSIDQVDSISSWLLFLLDNIQSNKNNKETPLFLSFSYLIYLIFRVPLLGLYPGLYPPLFFTHITICLPSSAGNDQARPVI